MYSVSTFQFFSMPLESRIIPNVGSGRRRSLATPLAVSSYKDQIRGYTEELVSIIENER